MVPSAIPEFLSDLRQSLLLREGGDLTDGQLLEAFVAQRDRRALEALVRRHAPMVWGVCRRSLAHHDAEDAFQATFLVLVRKAASIRTRELLANWLYGVAHKTACKARQMAAKRSTRETQGSTMPEQAVQSPDCPFGPDLWQVLHEELSRLPEKYRVAIVLCDLEGRSRADAAGQLRVREGTVASRLARGRALLARRLTRRNLGLPATSVAANWQQQTAQALPDSLLTSTIETDLLATGQPGAGGLLSRTTFELAEAVLQAMAAAKWKRAGFLVGLVVLVGLALGGVIVIYQTLTGRLIDPDPPPQSPVTVTVVVAYPGVDAKEVERQLAIPLELGFADLPRLQSVRSKSQFGVCWVYVSFQATTSSEDARRDVIDRLATIAKLPPKTSPQIAPGLGGDTLRYVLKCPQDVEGRQVYTLHDLRSLQDLVLEREFRMVPGVADVMSQGGVVKRYEIHPDPDRLRLYGITLNQLMEAINKANANVGGDYVNQDHVVITVRKVGLLDDGADPFPTQVLNARTPQKAAEFLRDAERRRILEIRKKVVATLNNRSITVEDVIEGERVLPQQVGMQGVVIGGGPLTDRVFAERQEVVHGVVLLQPGDDPKLLRGVRDRIRELNTTAGRILPGVRVEPYYASTDAGENHVWVYGTLPLDVSLESATELAHKAREVLHQLPEVEQVVSQIGGPAQSFNQLCFFVSLQARAGEPRSRPKLIAELKNRLTNLAQGTDWLITPSDPLASEQSFPGTPAEHLLLIVGPDCEELERLAGRVKVAFGELPDIENVGVFPSIGRVGLEFRIDLQKCAKWGLKPDDVTAAIQRALEGEILLVNDFPSFGKGVNSAKGEGRLSDITVRLPLRLRESDVSILDKPVDILNNMVAPAGPASGVPSGAGSLTNTTNPVAVNTPRLRIRDLVSPVGDDGSPDASKDFYRYGPVVIYRSRGMRSLPIRYSVRGRSLGEVQTMAEKKITPLLKVPYRIEWTDARE